VANLTQWWMVIKRANESVAKGYVDDG
jgi:hypothetical protein